MEEPSADGRESITLLSGCAQAGHFIEQPSFRKPYGEIAKSYIYIIAQITLNCKQQRRKNSGQNVIRIDKRGFGCYNKSILCGRVGMADKLVLETSALRVRVQVPPPAPCKKPLLSTKAKEVFVEGFVVFRP